MEVKPACARREGREESAAGFQEYLEEKVSVMRERKRVRCGGGGLLVGWRIEMMSPNSIQPPGRRFLFFLSVSSCG